MASGEGAFMRAKTPAHRAVHTPLSAHSVREGVRKWRKPMILLRAQVCISGVQTERTYTPCVFRHGGCAMPCVFLKEKRKKEMSGWRISPNDSRSTKSLPCDCRRYCARPHEPRQHH